MSLAIKKASTRSNLWGFARQESPTNGSRACTTVAVSQPAETGIEFWKQRLQVVPATLALPIVNPGARIARITLSTTVIEAQEELSSRIRQLARRELSSPAAVILAAWQALLFRYSDQEAFVVGSVAEGANFAGVHLVHATVHAGSSFRDLLRLASSRRAEGAANSGFALEELAASLTPPAPTDRHPVFQTAVVQRPVLPSKGLTNLGYPGFTPCDLVLFWADDGASFQLRMDFPAGVMETEVAERIPAHLLNLIRAGLSLPDAPITALPIRSAQEYAAMRA